MTRKASQKEEASLWVTLSAVVWAFLGVRRKSDYQRDIQRLNPLHLVAVGIFMALLFVLGLIFLVNWVVTQG